MRQAPGADPGAMVKCWQAVNSGLYLQTIYRNEGDGRNKSKGGPKNDEPRYCFQAL